ncbi:MAG: hypothetical protein J6A97_03700 [Clostridia bacterium]|nr:hypothetical protein [Clostridia bacterium]
MKYVISLKSDYAKCYFSNKMNELIFEANDYNEIEKCLTDFENRNKFFLHTYTLIEVA